MNHRKDHIDALGAALLVYCSASMGINQVLVKIVNGGLQPVFQAGLRSALAFLPVYLYARFAGKRLSVTDGSLWPGLLAGVFFAAEFMLLFQALDYTTVSRASIFFYTMPVWTAIAAHFLFDGERLNLVRITGLVLATAGVVLALVEGAGAASDRMLLGDLMCIVAAMLWSGIILLARKTKLSSSSPEMQLLYQLAVSGVILVAIAPVFGPVIRELDQTIVILFSIQVLVVVCVGFLTWFWVLSVYPASKMATFSFLSPLFGVFFGWLILDDVLHWSIIAALILISMGVYLVSRREA